MNYLAVVLCSLVGIPTNLAIGIKSRLDKAFLLAQIWMQAFNIKAVSYCLELVNWKVLQTKGPRSAEHIIISHRLMRFIVAHALTTMKFSENDYYNFDTLFKGCFGPPKELQRMIFDPKYFPFELWRTKGDWANSSNFESSKNEVTLESGAIVNLLGEELFCLHFTGSKDLFDAAMSIGIMEKDSPTKPGILWIEKPLNLLLKMCLQHSSNGESIGGFMRQ